MALAGKTVVVFGGSSGMGKGTAKHALAAGGHVWLVSRSQPKLDAAAAWLGGGDKVCVCCCLCLD
jgi:NAD(P)-dependent dehydrogenase (short-subunit alcohol dehydrogenase family)